MFTMMTLAEAEQVEESIARHEAEAWLKMIAWAALPPASRRGGLATDPSIATLPQKRVEVMLSAVIRIIEHADRQPSERILV